MINTDRLIYVRPNDRRLSCPLSPKQLSWRKRVSLLWRLKGIVIPMNALMTEEEKMRLTQASTLIHEVIRDFSVNSTSLGFNSVNRCYYCGKPATTIDERGHYICKKCENKYGR